MTTSVSTVSVSTVPPSNAKAAIWMTGWLTAMLLMMIAGREVSRELHVFQLMEMRSVIGLFLLYPLIRASGGLKAMRTSRPLQHIGRNVIHYTAQFGWFLALSLIPLAQVVAIEFTMPIWTALLAVSVLGERLNIWNVIAIVLGLIGVIVIVQPGAEINQGQLLMVAVAIGFGASIVMVKSLTRTDSAVTIVFWMLIIQSAIGIIPAAYYWHWPSASIWPWILLIAVCGTYSHYCMTQAMRYADATVVVPMDFLRVPLAATAGWLLYSEGLSAATLIGAGMILTGNLLNLKRSEAHAPASAEA